MMRRVVVPEDSQDGNTWLLALAYAKAICEAMSPQIKDVILLVHTKRQFDGTCLAGHVGRGAAKSLAHGKSAGLPWSATLRLGTMQTIRTGSNKAVVIAYFADNKLLELVDGLVNVAGVVAVPDFPDCVDQWISRWNPIVHGQAQRAEEVLIEDAVFENGLRSITSSINLANGIMNPRDKQTADEALRILRVKGHVADPQKIKSWAIKNGWKLGAANELAALATKISNLKSKPSVSHIYNAEGKYASWLSSPS